MNISKFTQKSMEAVTELREDCLVNMAIRRLNRSISCIVF